MTFRISLPVATATLLLIPAAMLAWDLFLRPQPASFPSLSAAAEERPRSSPTASSMASGHAPTASAHGVRTPGQTPAPSPRHSLSGRRDLSHGKTPIHPPAEDSSDHQEIRRAASSRASFLRDSSGPSSSPAVLPSAAVAPVPANPADAGNHFIAHGQLIEVTASEPSPAGPILHIQLTETSRSSSAHPSDPRLGFSPEEELFRTKWGWEAFDRVQRAALQEASLVR
ncbi:MAG: hypothetical protein KF712_02085 [Akkermansiaceae bacterium]|nr:hypothetical protein [Akkermansiaceae bacterium]